MKNTLKSLKVLKRNITIMKEGESQIFASSGMASHDACRTLGFKIKTEKCYMVRISPLNIYQMTLATRPTIPVEKNPASTRLLVSTSRLKAMKEGYCQIFTEPHTKNTGAPAQGFASRCNFKIKTEKCLIIIPSTFVVLNAIIVTRLQEEESDVRKIK